MHSAARKPSSVWKLRKLSFVLLSTFALVNIQSGYLVQIKRQTLIGTNIHVQNSTESPERPANALVIHLSVSDDRYYVALVTVGTPGTPFAMALDSRISGS